MEKKYYSFLSVDKQSGIGVAEGVVSKNYGTKVAKEKNVFTIDVVCKNVAKKINYALTSTLKDEESTFMRVAFWGDLADRAVKVIDKGAIIDVFGKFSIKTYEGKNGTVNYAEIQARDFKVVKFAGNKIGAPGSDEGTVENTATIDNAGQSGTPTDNADDGDMPF